MSTIAEKVAFLRSVHKLTLKQLSDMTGISVSHLSAIENGTRPNPSFHYITRLAKAFDVPLTYFAPNHAVDEVHNLDEATRQWAEGEADFVNAASDLTRKTGRNAEEEADIKKKLERLYDDETQNFIVAESSRPYVSFAKQLAEQVSADDISTVLQLITDFVRERKATRES
jgi:transcriptional regulator with XRE-family HTH domain